MILEDHPMFREHLVKMVESTPDMTVVAFADRVEDVTAEEFVRADVVLLDLTLRGLSGIPVVHRLATHGHRVVVFSNQGAPATVTAAIKSGARGYMTKHSEEDEVLAAVRSVARGGLYVGPRQLDPALAAHVLSWREIDLTQRELQVLELVADGETDKQIARSLGIALTTELGYLRNVRDKLHRRRRIELLRFAAEYGISPPSR
ncbi:response regulator transcription factor [Streptomyces sp. S.PB5]|uniref:response regulator n=1 Tax=Streptomyces sp. S.PB5 TaxID=3020844 RepID=UPI0025AF9A3A|nr:response regulator transcription factor [Streptomyces sp. S.PB5]MDN3021588.1 response regulator transcription factor [Streptomyces sp. S.PB5]